MRLVERRATGYMGNAPAFFILMSTTLRRLGSKICCVHGENMKRRFFAFALLALSATAWCQAPASAKPAKPQQVSPYAEYVGDWISTLDGKVWLLLQLELHGDQLTGWLTHPHDIEMNDEGGLRSVSEEKVK
jgi:hypothetical protein